MPPRMTRAVVWLWIIFTASLALLSFGYNSATWINSWPWWGVLRITTALPVVLTVLLGLWFARTTQHNLPVSCGLWLLFGLSVLQLISAAVSEHPAESLGIAIVTVSGCCLAVAVALSLRAGIYSRATIMRVIGLLGFIFCVVSMVMWLWNDAVPTILKYRALNATLGIDVFRLNPDGFRNSAPFGHPNFTAGAAILFLPWLAGLVFAGKGRWRLVWMAVSLLAFLVLLSTGSRGAVIGLAAGIGFALLLVAQVLRWSTARMAAVGLLAIILLGIVVVAVPRVRNSVVNFASGREMTIGDEQRVAMLQIGTEMGAEKWIVGQGPGLVPRLYPRYRDQVEGGTDIALQLHSTPVQIWAETGILGLLCVAALVIFSAVEAIRFVRDSGSPAVARWMVASSGVSLVAYLGFALTDYQFDVPLIAALSFANVGVLIAARVRSESQISKKAIGQGWVIVAGGGIALLLLIVLSVPEWRARSLFGNAVARLERGISEPGEWNAAVIAATELQPDIPHYLAGGAAAHLRLGFTSADANERGQHLAYARAFLEQVLRVEPYSEFAHFNLGWLLLESDPEKSVDHFKHAARLLPDRGGCYFGLGLALLESGNERGAIDAFALEIINDPAFVTAPTWDTPALDSYLEDALKRASEICGEFELSNSGPLTDRVSYIHLLLDWLAGDDAVSAPLAEAGLASVREMFNSPENESIQDWGGMLSAETSGWLILREASQRPLERRNLLERFIFAKTRRVATDEELDVLEMMVEHYGVDWRGWLRSEESRNTPFVKSYRRDRHSYPILFRNMDIPIADDAYLIQESTLIEIFFRDVFPRRGYAPDKLLLRFVSVGE